MDEIIKFLWKFLRLKMTGSVTVEGSWIMSICLLLIGMGILLGYRIYDQSVDYVLNDIPQVEVVRNFRIATTVRDLIDQQ
ncbi:MAG: hypothetical protein IJ655_05445 [Lachnospiraceae bacterium]|nr:hypothetical protein [Lachnospiraceae bacterium]